MPDDRDRPLEAADLAADPAVQLTRWLDDARAAGSNVAEVMTLATSTNAGLPSARMVLLKDAEEAGLTFYTSYESRKGRELAENPRAAAVLYWHELGRQVRAEGPVERLPPEQSDAYFASRPLGSRLSAAVSHQSAVVASRDELERAAAELGRRTDAETGVPRPEHWGGYRLIPELWEFWQHRVDRLHDRFRYRPAGGSWIVERLAP
jgi:pyridoxamine 5'-phosphate oxidase